MANHVAIGVDIAVLALFAISADYTGFDPSSEEMQADAAQPSAQR
jgi:hypothetical protein